MIKIEVQDQNIINAFRLLEEKTGDLTPAFNSIGRSAISYIGLGFRNSVDPYGKPWLPLKWRSGQPLKDTGRLSRAFVSQADRRQLEVGTNLKVRWRGREYSLAAIHQFGAIVTPKYAKVLRFQAYRGGPWIAAKKTVIPPRPMLPLSGLPTSWRKMIFGHLTNHLGQAIQRR